ncbi:MAG: hypothetical protein GXZ14_00800 [Ruminococcaceae bacterium]|nr:hypothetical protein [Oscillospiraceae bacterium]
MYRGTTPKIVFRLRGIKVGELKKIFVTFKQSSVEIEKGAENIDTEINSLQCTFTQEETLQFDADERLYVQLRAITKDGSAIASGIASIYVADILKDGVITDD